MLLTFACRKYKQFGYAGNTIVLPVLSCHFVKPRQELVWFPDTSADKTE